MGKYNHRQLDLPFSLKPYIPTKRERKKTFRDSNRELYELGIDQGYSKEYLNSQGLYEQPTEQHTRELPSKSNQRMHRRRIRKRAEKQLEKDSPIEQRRKITLPPISAFQAGSKKQQ